MRRCYCSTLLFNRLSTLFVPESLIRRIAGTVVRVGSCCKQGSPVRCACLPAQVRYLGRCFGAWPSPGARKHARRGIEYASGRGFLLAGKYGCGFRPMPAPDSDACRAAIPVDAGRCSPMPGLSPCEAGNPRYCALFSITEGEHQWRNRGHPSGRSERFTSQV